MPPLAPIAPVGVNALRPPTSFVPTRPIQLPGENNIVRFRPPPGAPQQTPAPNLPAAPGAPVRPAPLLPDPDRLDVFRRRANPYYPLFGPPVFEPGEGIFNRKPDPVYGRPTTILGDAPLRDRVKIGVYTLTTSSIGVYTGFGVNPTKSYNPPLWLNLIGTSSAIAYTQSAATESPFFNNGQTSTPQKIVDQYGNSILKIFPTGFQGGTFNSALRRDPIYNTEGTAAPTAPPPPTAPAPRPVVVPNAPPPLPAPAIDPGTPQIVPFRRRTPQTAPDTTPQPPREPEPKPAPPAPVPAQPPIPDAPPSDPIAPEPEPDPEKYPPLVIPAPAPTPAPDKTPAPVPAPPFVPTPKPLDPLPASPIPAPLPAPAPIPQIAPSKDPQPFPNPAPIPVPTPAPGIDPALPPTPLPPLVDPIPAPTPDRPRYPGEIDPPPQPPTLPNPRPQTEPTTEPVTPPPRVPQGIPQEPPTPPSRPPQGIPQEPPSTNISTPSDPASPPPPLPPPTSTPTPAENPPPTGTRSAPSPTPQPAPPAPPPIDPPPDGDPCNDPCLSQIDRQNKQNSEDLNDLNDLLTPVDVVVQVFDRCEDNEAKFIDKTISVPKNSSDFVALIFDQFAALLSDKCAPKGDDSNVVVTVPDHWYYRINGDTPQLVYIYRVKQPSGNETRNYQLTIPYPTAAAIANPPRLPDYVKGNWEGIIRLDNNFPVVINANNAAEVNRVWEFIKPLIDPTRTAKFTKKVAERVGQTTFPERDCTVWAADYYAKGQRNGLPSNKRTKF